VRDGGLTATIEQFPAQQSALGVQTLVAFLKDGTKPTEKVLLLTPMAVTKDNLDIAERLGEVK
jgi:ABC-type sugar transport system substrate-binding protein